MSKEILFQIVHEYNTRASGIVLPTLLRLGEDEAKVRAKLDIGGFYANKCRTSYKYDSRLAA